MWTTSDGNELSQTLADQNWAVVPSFISSLEVHELSLEIDKLQHANQLRPAGIGRGDRTGIHPEIRRDVICWLDPPSIPAPQKRLLSQLEELKVYLNRALFLGLRTMEGHVALYPEGGFYRRHLDRFQDDDARVISIVLYLNNHWQREWGGQLKLYLGEQGLVEEVQPTGGTLVAFLSDQIPHEVIPALRPRKSFAGWYRR